jgi:hypothetical protein
LTTLSAQNAWKLLPHLIRPARGGAAALILVFAFLLWIASNAGFFGIPLDLLLLSWFFKYAYVLFDHVVRGYDEPPTLDINMVNPANEQRPLAQLLILLILGAGVYLATVRLSPLAGVSLAVLAALAVPASIAVLGLEGNPLKAIYPVALVRMIVGLGPLYLAVLGYVALITLLLGLLLRLHLWLPLGIALGMFATLSVFSALGGALYERRHELGLEAWHSPERTAHIESELERRESDRLVTEAYGLVRVGQHVGAWKLLQDWLTSRGSTVEDYRWLLPRVTAWPDMRYANRLAQEFVARLLTLRLTGEALDAVSERLKLDASFRPKTANATLSVAKLATQGGGTASVARVLLKDFGTRFPNDPQLEAANALLRQIAER